MHAAEILAPTTDAARPRRATPLSAVDAAFRYRDDVADGSTTRRTAAHLPAIVEGRARPVDDGAFNLPGARRAPAGLTFAAQHISQEVLSDGLHFENFRPAIDAYIVAAQAGHPRGAAFSLSI
ncbi:MAG: hypothetical protein HY057_03685 [Rhodospirillales bacterium]|nr:hypothetical protein [Rhodospirillales bacterium]